MSMRCLLMLCVLLHGLWLDTAWAQAGGGRGSTGSSGRAGDNFWRVPGTTTPPPVVIAAPVRAEEVEQGQLLLLSRDFGTSRQVLDALALESIRPIATARLRALGWDLALFQFADHATALQQLTQWRQRFTQVGVDFNHLYQAQSDAQGREYALGLLDLLPPARPAVGPPPSRDGQAAAEVHVGLLDTRVESTDWLRQATLTRRPFINDASTRQPDRPAHAAHGTAIASLVARVTPRVRLFAAEVMAARDGQAVTNSYRLIQGVDWLLDHRVRVINMSLAGRHDVNMATTVDELMRRDVVVVAAAGNQGQGAPPAYPAAHARAHAGVLAVTAVDAESRLYPQANRGAYVSVAAPGVQIWVPAASSGSDRFGARYVSGTSYASAYAAGAVAHWLAAHQGQPGQAATRRLRETAKDLGPSGRDESYGDGLLQVNAALGR